METLTTSTKSILADLYTISQFYKTQRCHETIHILEDAMPLENSLDQHGQLIIDCCSLSVDLDNEIAMIYTYIHENYHPNFPELETLVTHPTDYALIVKTIGNNPNMKLADLDGLLPSSMMASAIVALSNEIRSPLPEQKLKRTVDACDRALALDSARKKLLGFVESKIGLLAPNLSAFVGATVTAKLVGAAGGLSELSKMPASQILYLGEKGGKNGCYLEETDMFEKTPRVFRCQACHMFAQNCILAARIDFVGSDPTGKKGRDMEEVFRKLIGKWQERADMVEVRRKRCAEAYLRNMEKESCGKWLVARGKCVSVTVTPQRKLGVAKDDKKFKEKSYRSRGSGVTAVPCVSSLALALQGMELKNSQVQGNASDSGN